jgi:hypothetical protein
VILGSTSPRASGSCSSRHRVVADPHLFRVDSAHQHVYPSGAALFAGAPWIYQRWLFSLAPIRFTAASD